jgi:molecular chaperone IbpA
MQIRTIDAAALANLNRALIGFDRIYNNIEARSFNNSNTNYPPYNVLKYDENNYEIEIAVAGFGKEDISVEVDQDQLIIKGRRSKGEDTDLYIHRGLAARDFERAFTLPQYMEVGDVELTNGILHVKLTLIIPEALKPRRIEVK